MPTRVLSTATLGAWLLKASGAAPSTRKHVRSGFAHAQTWCVRPIHAHGRTTGPARDGVVPVVLDPLHDPLLRSELVGHPDLAGLEVLRMPAGSNPSYVTPEQLAVLAGIREELGRPG